MDILNVPALPWVLFYTFFSSKVLICHQLQTNQTWSIFLQEIFCKNHLLLMCSVMHTTCSCSKKLFCISNTALKLINKNISYPVSLPTFLKTTRRRNFIFNCCTTNSAYKKAPRKSTKPICLGSKCSRHQLHLQLTIGCLSS